MDEGELRVLRPDGRVAVQKTTGIGDAKQLIQPSGWDDAVLVVGSQGGLILGGDEPRIVELPESKAESPPKFYRWGDKALWFQKEDRALTWVGLAESGKLEEEDQIVGEPYLYGDKLLYLTGEGRYKLVSSERPEQVETGDLPFPADEAKVSTSGDHALIWSPSSVEVVRPELGRVRLLPDNPVLGAKVVSGGGVVLSSRQVASYFNPSGEYVSFQLKGELSEEEFADATFFTHDEALYFVGSRGEEPPVVRELGKGSATSLEAESLRAVVSTESGPPMLLVETSFDETRVFENGEVVRNPKTGEKVTHSIKGFKLYRREQGSWVPVLGEERSRIVGPANLIGNRFVFATQTEPVNAEGVEREVDGRYPHPIVVIHAVSVESGKQDWTYQAARADAPSPARLPEDDAWPLLTTEGPLLFTTEDNRLAALDLTGGQLAWASDELPLDESRPQMIAWGNSIGLVAVANTTKRFILFDEQGKVLESVRLNDIFNHARTLNLIGVGVICLALILYIYLAGKKKLFIRRIAGLEALDEAVGRSTEMGKPVLYVTGLADVDDIQTLAALSILSHVAKKTAEYDTPILATTSRAVTFSAAQEVVRDAFTIAGRPDSFSVESVRYISDDQFGYAAGVDGLMVREEPAANFYMGKFYAESLIFAETGNATGAIQIAGTAQANQLPFFVAACDYTLIGEELFAASAYLSGDPLQVGSLRGQDVGKAIVMVVLVVASIDASFGGKLTAWISGLIGGGAA